MNEYSFTLWHDHRAMSATASSTKRRTASRAERRQQLIDATMKCIARKGMSGTTLGDVASEAGLSQGIVNLHFESKDNLLNETLRALANDYRAQFDKTLERAGPSAALVHRGHALRHRAGRRDARLLAAVERGRRPLDRNKLGF